MLNPRWRHVLRRTWFTVGGVLAVLAIALAVLMALGQLLLPLVAHYPDRVAQMLSQRLDRPVRFASMQGHWQPSGPMLVLHQVEIGQRDGKPALTLPTARVKLDFGALVWPSRHWVNLRLSGLKLSLQRDVDGQWHVAGFGVAGPDASRSQHVTLDDLPGNLWLDDLELDIDDARSGHHYHVRVGPLRVSNGSDGLHFAGLLRRGTSSQALKVAGRVRDGGHSGRLYLMAEDTDLGAMFAGAGAGGYAITSGHGDLAVWLTWQDRRLSGATVDVDLSDLLLQSPAGQVKAPQWRGLVQYRRDGDTARVLFAPGSGGAMRVDIGGIGTDPRMTLRAHDLDTGYWLGLGAMAPGLPTSLGPWLAAAAPRLHLDTARLQWSRAQGIESLYARFDHLGLASAAGRPGVDHLHGVLRGDAQAVSLTLPAQPLTLDFAGMFREPLAFASVGGSVSAWHQADAWHIGTDGIDFMGDGVAGQVRGSVRLPAGGGAPYLDMYASLADTSVLAAKRFWPTHAMSAHTIEWLDRGLIDGSLDSAQVVLHGSMSDWPFTGHQGRFEAHADISGLALDFDPRWPRATNVSVQARFVDNGMLAVATSADVHGVKVKRAVASIPDFGQPELVLSAQGSGKGGDLMGLVRQSPIGESHADVLDELKLGGRGDFKFSMVVPLSAKAPDPFTLGGTVQLHDAAIDAGTWKLHLGSLNGALAFDDHGFQTRDLTATFQGQPVTLDMAVGPQTGRADWPLKVNMHGRFSFAQLAQGREALAPLAKLATGSAPFDIGFHIEDSAVAAGQSRQVLSVHSNLRGIQLDLPAPLSKPEQALWPLDVQLALPFAGGQLQVILGDRLYARARLPSKQRPGAVDVRLGGQAPSGAMPASGVRVRGRAAQLDVSGWVRYALSVAGGSGATMPLIDVNVTAEKTHIFEQEFSELRVNLHPESNNLELAVNGADIEGSVSVPIHDMDTSGIVARFDRLYWPSPDKHASTATSEPVVTSTAPLPGAAANVGVAPSSLPPMHIWIGDLRFGDARLGQARLESWPTAQGMHIGMLRTQSDSMHMAASGDWVGTVTDSYTHLKIDFSAANLGHMLSAFGYDGLFVGGETRAHLDATWPGAPSSFALANVEGTLGVTIGQGRIPEVKPGVGRLFGLMSIADLPRRLTLDFGDVFGTGFGFDSIKGHFRFHDGNAWTEDLAMEGPAADIKVTGRVGLRTQDYDQYVLAIPHIGNSLPIVGAVVAGPVGVAAGLAVQGLLGKGLNRAASARYHITGSWDRPEIKLVEKHVPKPADADPVSGVPGITPGGDSSIRRPVPDAVMPAPETSVSPPSAASVNNGGP